MIDKITDLLLVMGIILLFNFTLYENISLKKEKISFEKNYAVLQNNSKNFVFDFYFCKLEKNKTLSANSNTIKSIKNLASASRPIQSKPP